MDKSRSPSTTPVANTDTVPLPPMTQSSIQESLLAAAPGTVVSVKWKLASERDTTTWIGKLTRRRSGAWFVDYTIIVEGVTRTAMSNTSGQEIARCGRLPPTEKSQVEIFAIQIVDSTHLTATSPEPRTLSTPSTTVSSTPALALPIAPIIAPNLTPVPIPISPTPASTTIPSAAPEIIADLSVPAALDSEADDDEEDLEEIIADLSAADDEQRALCTAAFCRTTAKVPAVVELKGQDLVDWVSRPPPHLPSIILDKLVPSTRAEHRRLLNSFKDMQPATRQLPLTMAIICTLLQRRKAKGWRWSTTLKNFAATQGAAHLLPLYHQNTHPINLAQCVMWTSAVASAGQRAREELPNQPLAITPEQTTRVLDRCNNIVTFSAILLSWHSAARPCDILKLARADVSINENKTLSIRFRRGKGVRCRGPYTVHTGTVPQRHLDRLSRWLNERRSWLFPKEYKGATIKETLRTLTGIKELEQRSLRRGSLQCLSRAPGMTDEVLMLFSGHLRLSTLKRYLDWGRIAAHTQRMMTQAAGRTLVPPRAELIRS